MPPALSIELGSAYWARPSATIRGALPVDGLEHGVSLAGVGAAGGADASLDLRGFVGDYVPVHVGRNHDLELVSTGGVQKFGRHYVYVPGVPLDFRVAGRDVPRHVQEFAVGSLHDVRLGDDRDLLTSGASGVRKRGVDNPLRSGRSDYAEVDREVRRDMNALAADGVHVLCVLAEDGPVDTFLGYAHRPDVCEQVQLLAHYDVGALQVRPAVALFGGVRWSLERNVAILDLGHNVVGDGLHLGGAVLNGETLDVLKADGAVLDIAVQEAFEYCPALMRDGGTDAIATDNSYF